MATGTLQVSTRDAILAAARDAILELGYEATTIAEIRARSGASNGSVFHHFAGRAAIADALFQGALGSYQEGFLAALGGDARDGVRGAVAFHLRWVARNPDDARILARLRGAADPASLRVRNRAFFGAVDAWFQRTELRPLAFDLRHALLLGPAETICRGWLEGVTTDPPTAALDVLPDAAWEALRA